jgi:integrase
MALTAEGIQTLVPSEKSYMKADGSGLFLQVTPAGGRLWRYKFTFNGKSQVLALGKYPDVGLNAARKLRKQAEAKVLDGINPALERKQRKMEVKVEQAVLENTFEKVSLEWWEKSKPAWSGEHAALVWRRLELNAFPWIGNRPISQIEPPDLLQQIRRIEERGAVETAHRVLQIFGQVFRYAVAAGHCKRNQALDLRGCLTKKVERHFPAIVEDRGIKALMLAIDEYSGSYVTRAGLLFSAYTFQRPGEIRHAEWSEIDFENAVWNIPAGKMKKKRPHIVPLSKQVIAVLMDLHPLTGHGKYIFPSERSDDRPMSENTINAALRRLGYSKEEMVAHGFRTTASTRLHESGLFDSRVIEVAMAHVDQNTVRGVYNRAQYLDERRKMMQWYADFLDGIKEGGKVLSFKKAVNE